MRKAQHNANLQIYTNATNKELKISNLYHSYPSADL